MLEDPRINFAISTRGGKPGVDHLGFQTDTDEELAELKARAQAADLTLLDEGDVSCCYARSDKHWVTDPQGIAWEHFHTLGNIPVFSEKAKPAEAAGGCCATPAARSMPMRLRSSKRLLLLRRERGRQDLQRPVHLHRQLGAVILAEALLNHAGRGRFKAYSAGSHPTGVVNPGALERCATSGCRRTGARSKSWDEFAAAGAPRDGLRLHGLRQRRRRDLPVWPGQPDDGALGHARSGGGRTAPKTRVRRAFRDAAVTLKRRIDLMLALPLATLDAMAIRARAP